MLQMGIKNADNKSAQTLHISDREWSVTVNFKSWLSNLFTNNFSRVVPSTTLKKIFFSYHWQNGLRPVIQRRKTVRTANGWTKK